MYRSTQAKIYKCTHRHPHSQGEGINCSDFLGLLPWPKAPCLSELLLIKAEETQSAGCLQSVIHTCFCALPQTPMKPPSLLGCSWQSCRSGRALLVSYRRSPTSILNKAASHPCLFHCEKAKSSLYLCPHPRSTEGEVSMTTYLVLTPVTSALLCSLSVPSLFLAWVIAPAF